MSAELLSQASAIYADTGLTPDDLLRQRAELLDALQDTNAHLRILRGSIRNAARRDGRWAGMEDEVTQWVERNVAVIARATGETT